MTIEVIEIKKNILTDFFFLYEGVFKSSYPNQEGIKEIFMFDYLVKFWEVNQFKKFSASPYGFIFLFFIYA